MPRKSKNHKSNTANLKKTLTAQLCKKQNPLNINLMSQPISKTVGNSLTAIKLDNGVLVLVSRPSSGNKGYDKNKRTFPDFISFSLEFLDPRSQSIPKAQELFNQLYGSRRGDGCLILLALNVLAGLIQKDQGLSLSELCERTSKYLCVNGITSLNRKTIMFHWKRFSADWRLYSNIGRVFPPRHGRPRIVSDEEQIQIITVIKERLKEKACRFPHLGTFKSLIKEEFNLTLSLSTIARILHRYDMIYGPPLNGKAGTRYHDSAIVLEERVDFLLKKIWFLAWESVGKTEIFVHDESWVAEKPSGIRVWSYNSSSGKETINPGKKIGGRRIAFSSLYSVKSGLITSVENDVLDSLDSKIGAFKQSLDELGDYGVSQIFEIASEHDIPCLDGMSLDKKNSNCVEVSSDSLLFHFVCQPANKVNKVAIQMESEKFLSSVEKMVRQVDRMLDKGVVMVLQLDNATYHREPEDKTLRAIKHPYPLMRSSSTAQRPNMLALLKEWDYKPQGADDTWFDPIVPPSIRITKNTPLDIKTKIEKVRRDKLAHQNAIKQYFRMAPQYRHQKTRVEALVEQLGEELDRSIIVLWGARGHSELAEIEFCWSFVKRFIADANPQRYSDTLKLLKLGRTLDFGNRLSWRDNVLINMEAYLVHGYFDLNLSKKLNKSRAQIHLKYTNLFKDIVHIYPFTQQGFDKFVSEFSPTIETQKSYQEIIEL